MKYSRVRDDVIQWLFELFIKILMIGGALVLSVWAVLGFVPAILVAAVTVVLAFIVFCVLLIFWKVLYRG